jgi:hypothetical protein
VFELPLHYQPVSIATAQQQTWQLDHGHPLLNTNQLIRRPDLLAFQGLVMGNSLLRSLVDLGRAKPPLSISDADIDALRERGFRYLVLHDQITGDAQHLAGERAWADLVSEPARSMLESMMGEPIIQTATGRVYDLAQAELVAGRTRTWTGQDFRLLKPPFDTAETGFVLHLEPAGEVEITEQHATQFSLWARPGKDNSGTLEIRIYADGKVRSQPIPLLDNIWQYTKMDIKADGPVRIALVAGEDGTSVALTRMQVRR